MRGLVLVRGVIRQVTGNGTVSAAGDVTGTITVAARSVHTKNKRRDEHLPGRNVVCQILAARRHRFDDNGAQALGGRVDGGRGLYFDDPDGHRLEIITRPYGSGG